MINVTPHPKIVIVGAGFGGLFAVRALADQPVDVLLIDRRNYHTFTPLLYQVATCALDPSEIAYPVRTIFKKVENVRFLFGRVVAIAADEQTLTVHHEDREIVEPYDYLVVATGSTPTYFGNEHFRAHALELRTLDDALALRTHILKQFEQAAWTEDVARRNALTTIVVVGGGPTGLETAGAIYELYNHVLNEEYRQRQLKTRVILVEMQPYLLAPYPEKLREAALQQLHSLGVEVILGTQVTDVAEEQVTLGTGQIIDTHTLVWTAGVKASPVAELLDVELARGGRIPVAPTLTMQGKASIYAIGDIAYLEDASGQPYPMLIPVAQQQGTLAARNILADIAGESPQPFAYQDRGSMATIGRSRAVAWIYNRMALQGYFAWLAWLGLHLLMLMGFRNRLNVFINWVWNYMTYDRAVRIIWDRAEKED